ncbi:bifunctional diaminohydroxyphosphoribosylaminopyrimidine deaminase/5-amino-6-(5-phosphoribosylamino)uracil reductase RibD [Pedosphaera parvula]|uniref:Riboflavin biosynthesis protein RibD n=1 Tax=Pedosphaera parvula (strain Ellin514) TaxID=320771 RepID=B9XNZ0_PEDPL|nr:bifunctional diaminohydroxyphosphoribosylaminopyrimidine deaminase/5-amino-6-(5-phosphoribosylamino)uracil reductase RibD [Pedosphaera parvula]EEF58456.1 riboflavin biosynthesis protein RibD [Pedosphaera parvula Ellin514]
MQNALALARRAYGNTSPNPLVGAVLVKHGKVIGRGWHHRAGQPHAEVEALKDAASKGNDPKGATLYVTLEPCCTHGRTPPCTEAIKAAKIKKVVVAATDPNPAHAGRAFPLLERAGIKVVSGILAEEAGELNESFNHWIVHGTPLVIVKAAMTLDGKIATAGGESKWITGEKARAYGMKLRQGADAILVGVNTVLADDPSLTVRVQSRNKSEEKKFRRIILDSQARTPLKAKVVSDEFREFTTIVVLKSAPERRVTALARQANVLVAPEKQGKIDLRWLVKKLGGENVMSLLVEGGGEVNASFLLGRLAHRVAFFYAPKILGGRDARKGVAGDGSTTLADAIKLKDVEWRRLGADLLLTARVDGD